MDASCRLLRSLLRAVAGIDVDVFNGEVAGPDAGGAGPGMQVEVNWHVLRQHFPVNQAFVERVLAAMAADGYPRDPNVRAPGIERHAGASGGGEDTAPVGIRTSEG